MNGAISGAVQGAMEEPETKSQEQGGSGRYKEGVLKQKAAEKLWDDWGAAWYGFGFDSDHAGTLDLNYDFKATAINIMVAHANFTAQGFQTYYGACAYYVNRDVMAASIALTTSNASSMGPNLVKAGFVAQNITYDQAQRGDIAVIGGIPGHSYGHEAIYNGFQWVSDTVQRGFFPSAAYVKANATYKIYRYLWN